MDVTNQNFITILPEIVDEVTRCDFVAIDTEMSGLLRQRSSNRFDLPSERFAKVVESSRGYFIMQFGLSCFTRVRRSEGQNYKNRTYNFYIFPQAQERYGDMNRTFSIEAHAIQFLTAHNFDFNKLFKLGVSYLTFEEKKILNSQIKHERKARAKVELNSNNLPKFVPKPMVDDCHTLISKVSTFVKEKRKLATGASDTSDTELVLKGYSNHHKRNIFRRVLEQGDMARNLEVRDKYDPESNETFLVIKYIDENEKELKQAHAITNALGFFEVLEKVIAYKKPIVGHNLFLDLIQIVNQFIEPLSDDYSSFKETVHSLFPYIYDTKYVAHSILEAETLTKNQSRLEDLYAQLRDGKEFPRINIEHLGEFVDENQAPHQAGYDAYMSGYCFIVLCESYLRELRKVNKEKLSADDLPPLELNEIILEEFANKIHLSYSHDFKCYELNGEEFEPCRNHVFYVEHPETWVLDDLFQIFYQYGGVDVSKLSKTRALCALRRPTPGNVQSVLNGLCKKSSFNYKIYSYQTYIEEHKNKKRDKRKAPSLTESNDEDMDDIEADMS